MGPPTIANDPPCQVAAGREPDGSTPLFEWLAIWWPKAASQKVRQRDWDGDQKRFTASRCIRGALSEVMPVNPALSRFYLECSLRAAVGDSSKPAERSIVRVP